MVNKRSYDGVELNRNKMILNFLFAIGLLTITFIGMVTLDTSTTLISNGIKRLLKFAHRSKLLTEYILRAYMRYRKTIKKPLLNKTYST